MRDEDLYLNHFFIKKSTSTCNNMIKKNIMQI